MKHLFGILGIILIVIIIHSCKKEEVPTLTTSEITDITSTSAISGGSVSDEGSETVIARGVCWSINTTPSIFDSKTLDGTGAGSFSSNITGLHGATIYYLRAYATNSAGTGYGITNSFTTEGVTDYDGNKYNIIAIGNQVWMAENLKTTKYNNGDIISNVTSNAAWVALSDPAYCWYTNDEASYKAAYGALYNWYAVDAAGNGGKNVCPSGWHVPSDAEWMNLIEYLGGEQIAGGKLKEAGTTHWQSPNAGATNQSHFDGLPSGNRIGADGGFYNLGGYAIFWSSDQSSLTQAINRVLVFDGTNFRIGYDNKTAGFSVRCIKDQ